LLWAVAGFGLATIGFGFSRWFWLSFLSLFVCGAMDNVSVIVRHTLVQLLTPDEKRGRVSAVNSLFIGTSNELGGFESGFVAFLFGPVFSVVSGGIGTILVVIAVAVIWPEMRKYGRLDAG
jgi:MFS family permease